MRIHGLISEIKEMGTNTPRKAAFDIYNLLENNKVLFQKHMDADVYRQILGDFEKMADSMMKIGMTSQKVNTTDLAKDLEVIYQAFTVVDPTSVLNGAVNDNEINQLMLEIVAVGEKHGIRFPRAFALLFKQILYFDRYIKILAPDMELFNDDRLQMFGSLEDLSGKKPSPRVLH